MSSKNAEISRALFSSYEQINYSEKFVTFHESLCLFPTGDANLQSGPEDNCSVGLMTNPVLMFFT